MFIHFSKTVGIFLIALCLININSASVNADITKGAAGNTFDATVSYTVQPGDSLSEIAKTFGTDVKQLMRANNLDSTVIHSFQTLIIPSAEKETIATSRGNFTREDFMLLARAIYAESRGEDFNGQVAVGAVILNRVHSPHFPNTVREVILQQNDRICQFTPVSNGTIHLTPDSSAIKAASKALEGYDPTGGALFFYNPSIATDKWIKTLPIVTVIGKHVFATKT